MYKKDGTPELDSSGEYVIRTDENGEYIPALDSNGAIKHKHLYAVITDKVVNYRQFGAKLDGTTDDEQAIRLTHQYQLSVYDTEPMTLRKRYLVTVANHSGIIKKTVMSLLSVAATLISLALN